MQICYIGDLNSECLNNKYDGVEFFGTNPTAKKLELDVTLQAVWNMGEREVMQVGCSGLREV